MPLTHKPVTPEELAAGYGTVVVTSYCFQPNELKHVCLLIVRTNEGTEAAYSLPSVDLAKFCAHVKRQLSGATGTPPDGSLVQRRSASDWSTDETAIVTSSAVGVLPEFSILGMRLTDGRAEILTLPSPMLLFLTREIEAALTSGGLIDLSSAKPPGRGNSN